MGFPTENDHDLGCVWGVPPFIRKQQKNTPWNLHNTFPEGPTKSSGDVGQKLKNTPQLHHWQASCGTASLPSDALANALKPSKWWRFSTLALNEIPGKGVVFVSKKAGH